MSNEKTILINNDINSNLIERLVIPIIIMNKADDIREENDKQFVRQNEPINILINSGGGNAHETMSAVSVILSSETPVHTYALGKAMSGGFYILIAGHQRYAQMFSSVLYHQIQCGFGGTQPAQQHIEHMTENLRLQSALDAVIFERTKIKKKKLDEINAGFDKEIADIRKANSNIPAVGTKEGDEFETELAQIGVLFLARPIV